MATTELIVPVIICGGAGSRLWPASRESFPKQFIALLGEHSMFQKTLARVKGALLPSRSSTHADFRFLVASQTDADGHAGRWCCSNPPGAIQALHRGCRRRRRSSSSRRAHDRCCPPII